MLNRLASRDGVESPSSRNDRSGSSRRCFGILDVPDQLLRAHGRAFLRALALPAAAAQRIEAALAIIDAIDCRLVPLERELAALARRQAGGQALMRRPDASRPSASMR